MKSVNILLLVAVLAIFLSGCDAEMESVPRDVNFTSFYPQEGTTGIEPFISLYWGSEFAVNFDLLFGTDPENLPVIVRNLETPDYYVAPLFLSTTYYWQIRAYNIAGDEYISDIHSFRTRDPNWQEFYPPAHMTDLPLVMQCNWNLNRNQIDNVTYNLSLGKSESNLLTIAENLTETSYILDSLLYFTNYYWQVSMYNSDVLLSSSPILHFRTQPAEWNLIAPLDGQQFQETSLLIDWEIENLFLDYTRNSPSFNTTAKSSERYNSQSLSYDLYLGNTEDALELLAANLSDSQYNISNLNYDYVYFWQVKANYLEEQEIPSPVYRFSTRDRFQNFSPEPDEVFVEIDPLLSWNCTDALSYDLFFGLSPDNMSLLAADLITNTYQINNLDYNTEYYWKVIAELQNGMIWESPMLVFATTINPVGPGNKLKSYSVRADLPCNIDVVYKVLDLAEEPDMQYDENDFLFLEDGEEIDPAESLLEIKSGTEINSTNKTVLMIDNSSSMDSLLFDIKLAAFNFVDNMAVNQEMCIYTFSEQAELIQDFTSEHARLINAINSIESGYASTDLYGSFITGVEHWSDFYFPENIIKGNLILITDGSDTQSSTTLDQALQARGNHFVYTIGIGTHVDIPALTVLANKGFFHVAQPAATEEIFTLIREDMNYYLTSFYWLHYITPKRGDFDHFLEISIPGNHFIGAEATIIDTFNSNNFYGILPGVYVNPDPENGLPYGIEEYVISDSLNHTLQAVTYNPQHIPSYTWQIADPRKVTSVLQGDSGGFLVIKAGRRTGSTYLTVTDTANGHVRNIEITNQYEPDRKNLR